MEFKFKYKGKKKKIDVKVLRNIFFQARGLMFKDNSQALLFIFKNKKRKAIHSFFCKPFIAIWFDDGKIVDIKVIKNYHVLIKPKEKFNKLLEIPSSNKNFKDFIDDKRKI